MFFKIKGRPTKANKRVLTFLGGVYVCLKIVCSYAWAEEEKRTATLSVKPNRCVALHEGQDCYQNIVIRWQSDNVGHYCLVESQSLKELQCWQHNNSGELRYDFQSSKSASFSLLSMPVGIEIGRADMQVAWVYKARKRQRLNWRLF